MDSINNLETLVRLFVRVAAVSGIHVGTARQSYRALPYTTSGMLNWRNPVELQTLPLPPFARVGAIGDGNCMLHSILFCLSPTYRTLDYDGRQFIADVWRQALIARMDDLKDQADFVYAEIGGWGALEESFDRLPTAKKAKRRELDIEMAPLITRLYGHNCLAIQITTSLLLEPVVITFKSFDPTLPTVLINYLGGSTNFGAGAAASFFKSGHYEPIVASIFSRKATTSSSEVRHRRTITAAVATAAAAKAAKKKAPRVTLRRLKGPLYILDDAHTQYTVIGDDLEPVLDMFREAAAVQAAYVHPKGL
jgi:hypothetical protein